MGGEDGCAWMPPYFAIRARYFDEFWTSASQAGIHQMVNLASGLDSRVYRLPWTGGTIVYEIDQPEIIKFKMSELERISALPGTELRTVGIDLRDDWPRALQAAGFDPTVPTAWIAEGLMIGFLTGEAQDRLLNDITRLSASGSKLAADYIPGSFSVISGYMRQLGERWNEQGYHVDFANLYFIGEHNNARSYLQECGWDTVGATLFDLFANAGVPIPPVDFVNAAQSVLYLGAARR
jgi:methyltransferase (TIGR00027 family)